MLALASLSKDETADRNDFFPGGYSGILVMGMCE